MDETETQAQGELLPLRVGDKLRLARERSGKTLADVATKTRIPVRHLEAIETADYDNLPGRTYITGFARAYARALDLPEGEIGNDLRRELSEQDYSARPAYEVYEPTDPERMPSRTLAWTAAIIALLLASAYGVWRFVSSEPAEELATAEVAGQDAPVAGAAPTAATPTTAAATPAVPANAQVVLTGISEVWVGFDDAAGKTENWRTLDPGESMTVPADYIDKFTLRTARPQALKITVGGREVPQIGAADAITSKVSLKPADLMARATGGSAGPASGGTAAGPTAGATGASGTATTR